MPVTKRITLHPLQSDGTPDESINLYPKSLASGLLKDDGVTPFVAQEQIVPGMNVSLNQNNVLAVLLGSVAIVKDALTNINGRVLTAYEATTTTVMSYLAIVITYDNEKLTEELASNYMEFMTGNKFLPTYNYEKPKNSYMMFPDGTIWKPQYDSANGLLLYNVPNPLMHSQLVSEKFFTACSDNTTDFNIMELSNIADNVTTLIHKDTTNHYEERYHVNFAYKSFASDNTTITGITIEYVIDRMTVGSFGETDANKLDYRFGYILVANISDSAISVTITRSTIDNVQ